MQVVADEPRRLEALRSYEILESPAELSYDELTSLAARICRTPVAYLKFFDESRAWFKSHVGFPPDLTEVPRESTICNSTIRQSDLVVVPDCTQDDRFRDNPTVTGWPHIRFYCGMPLINPQGYALGTFCVLDFVARDDIAFEQQEAMQTLAEQVVARLELRRASARLARLESELDEAKRVAAAESARADALLCDILPRPVAEEYKATGKVRPLRFQLVTALFADFQGFSRQAEQMEPALLIQALDGYFAAFDEVMERHGVEKIKTIGDCYMAAGGLPTPSRPHLVNTCLAALEMLLRTRELNGERQRFGLEPWELRIGLHAGPVMTGVVGRRKFTYDIWGDAVNLAQRMEAAGEPGRINVSEAVYQRARHLFEFSPRGPVAVRGKGTLPMYFLDRIKPDLAADEAGYTPNERFTLERQRAWAEIATTPRGG
jgi:adenylate cyclase